MNLVFPYLSGAPLARLILKSVNVAAVFCLDIMRTELSNVFWRSKVSVFSLLFFVCKIFNPKRSRSVPFFCAVSKSTTGHEESVTKPVLKTAHYLFCHWLDIGNIPVER